jgi:CO/xanthine dehydrogenase FAD-binding subunit
MKPAPFDYHVPSTIDEAVGLLAEPGNEGKVLCHGQSLIPMLALRLTQFAALIDVGRTTVIDVSPRWVRNAIGFRNGLGDASRHEVPSLGFRSPAWATRQ